MVHPKSVFLRILRWTYAKNGLMGRQAVEKAIESLHERKSDSL
jgi:hypothetical protein